MEKLAQNEAARPSEPRTTSQLCQDARAAIAAIASGVSAKPRLTASGITELETAARVAVNRIESSITNTIADVVTSVLREHGVQVAVPKPDVTIDYSGPKFVKPLDLDDQPDELRCAIDRLFRVVVELQSYAHTTHLRRVDALSREARSELVKAHEALAYLEDSVRAHNADAFGDAFDDDDASDALSAAAEE